MTEQARVDWSIESLKAIVAFATLTLRSLIIINGGAVVVLMALLGSLWGSDGNSGRVLALALAWPFGFFTGGLIAAVLGAGFSYLAQVFFTEGPNHKEMEKWGARCRWVAIISAVASVFFFTAGAFTALSAFS